MNTYELSENDVYLLLKANDFDDLTSHIVADYLDQCSCEYNLTYFMANSMYFIDCFRTKEEALEFIDKYYSSKKEEVIEYMYESFYGYMVDGDV